VTEIKSAVSDLDLNSGELNIGGKVVLILGTKWRLRYYAYLNEFRTSSILCVNEQPIIGTVGEMTLTIISGSK